MRETNVFNVLFLHLFPVGLKEENYTTHTPPQFLPHTAD